jgi:hypothetical protein
LANVLPDEAILDLLALALQLKNVSESACHLWKLYRFFSGYDRVLPPRFSLLCMQGESAGAWLAVELGTMLPDAPRRVTLCRYLWISTDVL